MNKQNTKETLQKKCKSLTILTIVGWSLNVLLVLFLILCAALTPKQAHSQSAESQYTMQKREVLNGDIGNSYVYEAIYQSQANLGKTFCDNIGTMLEVDIDSQYSTSVVPIGTEILKHISLPSGTMLVDTIDTINVTEMVVRFRAMRYTDYLSQYQLYWVEFLDIDNNEYLYLAKDSYTLGEYLYTAQSYQVILSEQIQDNEVFLSFFQLSTPYSFVFNRAFNYNAPFNLSSSAVYGSRSDGLTSLFFTKTYNVGWFISNGELYNQIVWRSEATNGALSVYLDGEIKKGPQGYDSCVYVWLEYVNTYSNKTMVVNFRDQQSYEKNGAYGHYYLNSSTWYNDDYRYITFLQQLSDDNRVIINSFNNNNQNQVNGQIYDNENVFTLLGGALTSWSGIFGAMVLPGITIGTLLFVPLIATIVFAIIKIIKK